MDMKELMGKKKSEKNPEKRDAKMEALKAMREIASDRMRNDMGDKMQKVSVMAKDPKDLEKGLDKAKELVGKVGDNIKDPEADPVKMMHPDDMEEQMEDNHYAEADELIDDCNDPEKLDELMRKIADKKRELMMKKA